MEGTIAQVLMFAGTFAPRYWAFCQGQILSIASNTALFSILGTMYGGDGRTTFGLPDFQGRFPVGAGQGPGQPDYQIGQPGGFEFTTLSGAQLPAHNHPVVAALAVSESNATTQEPNNNVFANTAGNSFANVSAVSNELGGVSATIQQAGGSQPISLMQPYLGMNFVICLQGVFPQRP